MRIQVAIEAPEFLAMRYCKIEHASTQTFLATAKSKEVIKETRRKRGIVMEQSRVLQLKRVVLSHTFQRVPPCWISMLGNGTRLSRIAVARDRGKEHTASAMNLTVPCFCTITLETFAGKLFNYGKRLRLSGRD